MKRAAVLMVLVAGCGGDDTTAQPDVLINPGPDYDLSCVNNNTVSSVPTLLTFDTTVLDLTNNMATPIPSATVTAYTFADNTQVGTGTTDMDGKIPTLEITTTGSPARVYYEIAATGFVPSRTAQNLAPNESGGAIFMAAKQSRLDALASALGKTIDANNAVLEVWSFDCSAVGELPGATLQLDGADASWAMYGGVGVWIPRAQTLGTVPALRNGSVAGIITSPGVHTVRVQASGLDISATANVQANTWNVLVMFPGYSLQ